MWALPHLAGWSGMHAYWLVARGPRRPAALAAAITRLRNGLFRSRLAGQANAILIDRSLGSTDLGGVQISDEGRERRVVHAVRVENVGVVGNLHASNAAAAIVEPELERARLSSTRWPPPAKHASWQATSTSGTRRSPATRTTGRESTTSWLPTGSPSHPLRGHQSERRVAGRVLSDHAPVERLVGR